MPLPAPSTHHHRYHDTQPLVQQIWREMAQQLSVCSDCVNVYHQAKVGVGSAGAAFVVPERQAYALTSVLCEWQVPHIAKHFDARDSAAS